MARENYRKLITENTEGVNFTHVIPLTEQQLRGFIRFCKMSDTPSGNDRKTHFFLYLGIYKYHLDFITTSESGSFVKIKKWYND